MQRSHHYLVTLLLALAAVAAGATGAAQETARPAELTPAELKQRACELRPQRRAAAAAPAAGDAGATAHAAGCGSWLKISPPYSPSLLSVAYSGSTWMAVGTGGEVEVSTDAATWTWHYCGVYKTLAAVRYFNGRFVAVGEGGLIIWSTDGHTWTQPGSPTSNELRALAVGAGRIVAVGRAGTLLWSADGNAWNPAASPTSADIFAVAYFQGRFVAIDDDGWVLDSGDGVSWQKRTGLPGFPAYGSVLGMGASNALLVAVGFDVTLAAPGGAVVYTSGDGASWQKLTPALPVLRGVTSGVDQWVAVGDATIAQSPNGLSWSQVPTPLSDRIWDVAWGGNMFVAAGWTGLAVSGCSAVSSPAADFSWSPATVKTGQAVQFTDLSAGSPASWSWEFGDGATSAEMNPSHTYAAPGTVLVRLTVANSAGTSSVTKQVTVAAVIAAPVADFTWSPSPLAGQAVQFTDLSSNAPQAWSWNFAGQATSGFQNPTHVFPSAGAFSVTLTVTNQGGTASVSKTVNVGAAATTLTYWLPVASHAAGLNQSQWRSDLGLLNTGSGRATAQVDFYDGNGGRSMTVAVAAGAQEILGDLVGQLGGSGSGAVKITSDQPLLVTSRTYNRVSSTAACYGGGTQGQDFPVLAGADGLAAGDAAYLPGLSENTSNRCNIGLVNTGAAPASALVELYDAAGARLAGYTVALAAGQWAQATQPFLNVAGHGAMDRGFAKVTVQSGSGVFAFASLVDNVTNDPTTVVMQR